jgi:putative ABC transport system permease protein
MTILLYKIIIVKKGNTFINMFGLTIGLACCMVIFLYVTDEMSFDKYHENIDRIYRVAGRSESPNLISSSAQVSAPVAQVLSEHFPQVDAADLEEPLAGMAGTYAPKELMRSDESTTYFLQPVADIHLFSHLRNEVEPSMNPLYLYILSAIGIFVLLIACMNFINLSTARSTKRAKEVGVRKVIGANRSQLVRQFLSESLVIIVLALIFAVFLVSLLFPLVNNISGKTFTEADLLSPSLMVFMFILVLFVSLAAGAYPALFLSAFQPAKVLKANVLTGLKGSTLRGVLVVSQFAISIALIAGTLIMYSQINFMKNQYLGFEKEQKLIIPVRGILSLKDNYETVKAVFSDHPSITGTAVSSHVIGQRLGRWDTQLVGGGENDSRVLNHLYVGPDFLKEYGTQLISGRGFRLR